ncbi:1-acyl-sn-glycerol-3-phosphate acyltransferase, partial [Acidobacteriota bacterium]
FFLGFALLTGSGSMLVIILPILVLTELVYIKIEEMKLIKRYGDKFKYYRGTTSLVVPRLIHFLKVFEHLPFKLMFSLKIFNRENIPADSPYFLVSSHRNYFDPFFIIKITNRPVHFVATFEIFRNPLSRFIFKKLHCIPKKRYRSDTGAVKKTIELINRNAVIGIFPEGERSWTGRVRTFKPEVLKLLKKYHHIPVLPLKLEGNYVAWPRWGKNIRRANISITIQKPYYITKDQPLKEIEEQIKKLIEPNDSDRLCKSAKMAGDIRVVIYRCPVCRSFEPMDIVSNTRFACNNCRTVFSILPDYTIEYHDGSTLLKESIDSLYNKTKIQAKDIKPLPSKENTGIIIPGDLKGNFLAGCEKVFVYKERNNRLEKCFKGVLFLTNESLRINNTHNCIHIDLKNITSVTIESNYKMQIFIGSRGPLYQVTFPQESSLKWQDYILETIHNEFSFYPNRR